MERIECHPLAAATRAARKEVIKIKIGITFGGYCPLHQGHLDVIMRAKKENDHCYVIVCGYDNDRGGDYLPLKKRYRLIKEFLSSENVTVFMIDDTQLGLDESMSAENWKIWLSKAYELIQIRLEDNITWYVSEKRYVSDIINNSHRTFNINVELMDRSLNPISGTMCRENPLKYWNKITAPFRSYYSHNILVTGTASEGKTTLVQDIGKYFNIPYSYEKGRDNCALKTDPEFDVEDFIYNLYEQQKYNKALIHSSQNNGVFISDTDNIVTLMYAYGYHGRDGFALKKEDYDVLYKLTETYAVKTQWDKIFLIKPRPVDIVDDGERYMPDSDYAVRWCYYEFLKNAYKHFGYEYEELSGDYYSNFLTVKNYINKLYNEGNKND